MRQVAELSKEIYKSKSDYYQFLARLSDKELKIEHHENPEDSLSSSQKEKLNAYLDRMNQKIRETRT